MNRYSDAGQLNSTSSTMTDMKLRMAARRAMLLKDFSGLRTTLENAKRANLDIHTDEVFKKATEMLAKHGHQISEEEQDVLDAPLTSNPVASINQKIDLSNSFGMVHERKQLYEAHSRGNSSNLDSNYVSEVHQGKIPNNAVDPDEVLSVISSSYEDDLNNEQSQKFRSHEKNKMASPLQFSVPSTASSQEHEHLNADPESSQVCLTDDEGSIISMASADAVSQLSRAQLNHYPPALHGTVHSQTCGYLQQEMEQFHQIHKSVSLFVKDMKGKSESVDQVIRQILLFFERNQEMQETIFQKYRQLSSEQLQVAKSDDIQLTMNDFWKTVRYQLNQAAGSESRELQLLRENVLIPAMTGLPVFEYEISELYKKISNLELRTTKSLSLLLDIQKPENNDKINDPDFAIRRLDIQKEFRYSFERFKNEVPEIVQKIDKIDKTRMLFLNDLLKQFVESKKSWLASVHEEVLHLEEALKGVNIEKDIGNVLERKHSLPDLRALTSLDSTNMKFNGTATLASKPDQTFFYSTEREKRFELDMWGVKGLGKTLTLHDRGILSTKKNITLLEAWSGALKRASEDLLKAVEKNSIGTDDDNEVSESTRSVVWKSLNILLSREASYFMHFAQILEKLVITLKVTNTNAKALQGAIHENRSALTKRGKASVDQQTVFQTNHNKLSEKLSRAQSELKTIQSSGQGQAIPFDRIDELSKNIVDLQCRLIDTEREIESSKKDQDILESWNHESIAHYLQLLEVHERNRSSVLLKALGEICSQTHTLVFCIEKSNGDFSDSLQGMDCEKDLTSFLQPDALIHSGQWINKADYSVLLNHPEGFSIALKHAENGIKNLKKLVETFSKIGTLSDACAKALSKVVSSMPGFDFRNSGWENDYPSMKQAFESLTTMVRSLSESMQMNTVRLKDMSVSLKATKRALKDQVKNIVKDLDNTVKQKNNFVEERVQAEATYAKALRKLEKYKNQVPNQDEGGKLSRIGRLLHLPRKSIEEKTREQTYNLEKAKQIIENSNHQIHELDTDKKTFLMSLFQRFRDVEESTYKTIQWGFSNWMELRDSSISAWKNNVSHLEASVRTADINKDIQDFLNSHATGEIPPITVVSRHRGGDLFSINHELYGNTLIGMDLNTLNGAVLLDALATKSINPNSIRPPPSHRKQDLRPLPTSTLFNKVQIGQNLGLPSPSKFQHIGSKFSSPRKVFVSPESVASSDNDDRASLSTVSLSVAASTIKTEY